MKSWIKKTLLVGCSTIVGIGIVILPFLLFLQPANDFVFGNFHSYINEELRNELTNKYNIKWQYYGSNAQIPTFIQNKTLDIAIATNNTIGKLIKNQSLRKIPWDKFNIKLNETNTVKTYKDLEQVVTPATWKVCEIIGKEIGIENLLEYTVPYFMQNFVFAYRGKQIEKLNNRSDFKQIFDYISQDKEFNSKLGNVMMIEDSRSIYNTAKLMSNNPNINPTQNEISINSIDNVYNNIANYYSNKKNNLTFSPDSSIVLNKVALNQSKGAFMYNGDAIYSALGGDNPEDTPNLPNFEPTPDFHAIVPQNTFYAMDGIVINKSISDTKLNKAIDIIREISLSGLSYDEKIDEVNNENKYVYSATCNFNFINYTPCYSKLYNFAIDNSDKGYFSKEGLNINTINTLINLIKMDHNNINEKNIELPESEEFNSNLNIAFTTFKNKL